MSKELTPLSEVIDEISMGPFGSDIKVENFVSSGVPVLNGSNLSGFRLVEDEFKYVTKEKASTYKKAIARKGDIVITHRGTLGQISFIPDNSKYDMYVISQSQFRVRLKRDKADPAFFVYYFHTSEGQKRLLSFKNHVGVPALAQATTNFRKLGIPLPNLPTQQKIAAVLSALDAKIELNQRVNAELESMAKTLYDYWFVQFDFPNEKGKPYKSAGGKMVWNEELKREIPLGWEVCELSKIVSRIATGLNPRKNFVFGNGNNYYVTIKNIDYGKVALDDRCDKVDDEALQIIDRRSDLQIGDILFTSIEPVGKTYLLQEKPKNWNINESVFTIRPNYELVTSEYLYSLLSSEMIQSFTNQSSAGSTFKGIRIGILNTFLSAYPDQKLISDFSEIVKPILKKIDMLQKESQTLTEVRDWLLPMLMNGQVRV